MRTVGLPVRLGIGVLAATSVYAGAFASPSGAGSSAMTSGALTGDQVVSVQPLVVDSVTPSGAARAGYMVTSGRKIGRRRRA